MKFVNSLIVDIWYQFCTGIFIPTKIFNSLKENVYQAIRQGATIQFSRHALQHRNFDDTLRTTIDNFAQETIDALEAGIFSPLKYTDPAGSRQFTLAPMYSWQLRHIQLDKYTMPPILRSAGIPMQHDISHDDFQGLLWRCFDFAPIGFDRREALTTDRLKFW